MGKVDSSVVRFSLRSLLIAMAAVAAMVALSGRAMAFLNGVARDPRHERAFTIVSLSIAVIMPLVFFLVVGFTKSGLSSRRTSAGRRRSHPTD